MTTPIDDQCAGIQDDEHNTDVALLRYMLDSARLENRRLRTLLDGQHTLDVQVNAADHASPETLMPTRAHDGDAGFDLYVSERTTIEPNRFVDVPCGINIALPDHHWGLIIGRSSALRRLGLMVNQGVIDAGYRGPLFAGCWNLTNETVIIAQGDRVAQLIPLPLTAATLQVREVAYLRPGDRGDNGFGSTGT